MGRELRRLRLEDLRIVPIMKGTQNQVRVLMIRTTWTISRARKATIKMPAAATDGVYSYLDSSAMMKKRCRRADRISD